MSILKLVFKIVNFSKITKKWGKININAGLGEIQAKISHNYSPIFISSNYGKVICWYKYISNDIFFKIKVYFNFNITLSNKTEITFRYL